MERLTPPTLAASLLEAPGWARVGLTMPDPRMRANAAQALADFIIEQLDPPSPADDRQLALPIG